MTASVTFYNSAKLYLGDSTWGSLAARTWKTALFTSASNANDATQTIFGGLTNEVGTVNTGYTAGGTSTTVAQWNQATSTMTFKFTNNPQWTAGSANLVCRFAVVYSTDLVNGHQSPLLLYYLLDTTPADITTTSGNTFTIAWNANGVFTLT